DRQEASRVSDRIRSVSRRFLDLEIEHLGHLPYDDHVRHAVRRKRPFILEFPHAPASECARAVADRLLEGESSSALPKRGFLALRRPSRSILKGGVK
ncbi:MAG: MinD/ParA family protein, partial [Planctomycetota bacterium]